MVFSYLMLVATSGDTGSAVAHGFQSFVGRIVSLFKMIFSCSCLQSQENDLILYLSLRWSYFAHWIQYLDIIIIMKFK